MAAVRSCVFLLVTLVYLQVADSKPLFDSLLCDMVCTDDDIVATTVSTTPTDALDDLFSFDCSVCAPVTSPRPAQSIAVRLPAVPNGLNMNVTDNNGVLQFVLDAAGNNAAPQPPAPAAPAAPAAPPVFPAAPGFPAAPAFPANSAFPPPAAG